MQAEEWLIDVLVADPDRLATSEAVAALAVELVGACHLTPLGQPLMHRFPDTERGPGGITSLTLLSESHLAIHTWPERSAALVSLGSCRLFADGAVALEALVARHLGATRIHTRRVERTVGVEAQTTRAAS